jgi:hypothetical protein
MCSCVQYFLLLLACMALGFGTAFFLLFSATQVARGAAADNSDLDNYFGSIPRTLVTMLSMMTGNFDQNLFWQAQAPWLAVLLFVVYVLLMVVVLFNLLIAIMGDSFSKARQAQHHQRAPASEISVSLLSSHQGPNVPLVL